jgi:hypothetical protein
MRWFTFQTYKPKKIKTNEKTRITKKKITKNIKTLSKSKAFLFALCKKYNVS